MGGKLLQSWVNLTIATQNIQGKPQKKLYCLKIFQNVYQDVNILPAVYGVKKLNFVLLSRKKGKIIPIQFLPKTSQYHKNKLTIVLIMFFCFFFLFFLSFLLHSLKQEFCIKCFLLLTSSHITIRHLKVNYIDEII